MNGWLVVNEFVMTDKFNELFSMLFKAAMAEGIELTKRSNSEIWTMLGSCNYRFYDFFTTGCTFEKDGASMVVSAADIGLEMPDFILFWDKDIRLAYELERQGMKVFNSAQAIADCDDKAVTFLKLAAAGIKQPETYISPKKFHTDGLFDKKFLDMAGNRLGFPCVVKENFGSFGQQVYLAMDRKQLEEFVITLGDRPYIIQEYIFSSKGRDIRLEVVGDQVIAAMQRSNPMDFRANITNGGSMQPYNPTKEQVKMAVTACKVLGLDFAGVDILFGPGDKPLLCEVNSNAHFKNLFDCTRVNAAEYIIKYIKSKFS